MAEIKDMLQKVTLLDLKDSERLAQAVTEHLEELEEIAAYDKAKAQREPTDSLGPVLQKYPKTKKP